ncbi:helix-turn-helix domain-containing protein [Pseudoxanthomonas sp. Root630]|uniref:AraC family transcriptional regulator n=1 Tax=Pseudoxanthomonas sp. Root630 TaxID=1736574 RepID=UPI0009D65F27|nr:helix-turn-helix domain-containing protein [Pseudoxanthomonas sp. Root630]
MSLLPAYRRLLSPFRSGMEKVATRRLTKGPLVVTETVGEANYGVTSPVAYDDAFIVQMRLMACPRSEFFVDGAHVDDMEHGERSVRIHDLRRSPMADIADPFHLLYFYLPRATLDDLSNELGIGRIEDLTAQPRTAGAVDPIVEHMMLSIYPALENPDEINNVFAEHVMLALSAHVASHYALVASSTARPTGLLSAGQERRAKEMLDANLTGSVSITDLAQECGLSVRHFSRAFKQSTGMPPHRYLLKRRVEQAKSLLVNRELSISEIALFCGFADQSHLTRVFAASEGIGPAAFRRAFGNE